MSSPSPQGADRTRTPSARRSRFAFREHALTLAAAGIVLACTFGLGPFEAATHQTPTSLASLIP